MLYAPSGPVSRAAFVFSSALVGAIRSHMPMLSTAEKKALPFVFIALVFLFLAFSLLMNWKEQQCMQQCVSDGKSYEYKVFAIGRWMSRPDCICVRAPDND